MRALIRERRDRISTKVGMYVCWSRSATPDIECVTGVANMTDRMYVWGLLVDGCHGGVHQLPWGRLVYLASVVWHISTG